MYVIWQELFADNNKTFLYNNNVEVLDLAVIKAGIGNIVALITLNLSAI